MMDMTLGIILKVTTILLEIAFLSVLFINKVRRGVREYTFLVVGSILLIILTTIFKSWALVKLSLVVIITIIIMKDFFKLSLKTSIISSILFDALFVSCEFIVILAVKSTIGVPRYDILTNSGGAFFLELLSDTLVLIVIILISAFRGKTNLSRMDIKGWLIFAMYPLFSLFTLFVLVTQMDINASTYTDIHYLIFGIGLMFLNISLFYLLNSVIAREIDITRQKQLIDNAEHLYNMYESLSAEHEVQKSLTHDYINHLYMMQTLALKGDYETQKRYIAEQLKSVAYTRERFYTGNSIIDAVINRKFFEARNKDILFPIVSDNLSSVGISDSDLVTILSNIIDNAIEATEKCKIRKVTLKIKIKENNLYVCSTNTYLPIPTDEKHKKTTKPDTKNHGYGLFNIKRTVTKNHGQLFIEKTDKEFCITVIIPL